MMQRRYVPIAQADDDQGYRVAMMIVWRWITQRFRRLPKIEPPSVPPPPPPKGPSKIEQDMSVAIDDMRFRRERVESILRRAILDDAVIPRHRRKPRTQGGH